MRDHRVWSSGRGTHFLRHFFTSLQCWVPPCPSFSHPRPGARAIRDALRPVHTKSNDIPPLGVCRACPNESAWRFAESNCPSSPLSCNPPTRKVLLASTVMKRQMPCNPEPCNRETPRRSASASPKNYNHHAFDHGADGEGDHRAPRRPGIAWHQQQEDTGHLRPHCTLPRACKALQSARANPAQGYTS